MVARTPMRTYLLVAAPAAVLLGVASLGGCQILSGLSDVDGGGGGGTGGANVTTGTGGATVSATSTSTGTSITSTGAGGCPGAVADTCTQGAPPAGNCSGMCMSEVCKVECPVQGVCSDTMLPPGDLPCTPPSGAGPNCSFTCNGSGANSCADGKTIRCPVGGTCTVMCTENGACFGATVDCNEGECTLDCAPGACDATTKVMAGPGKVIVKCPPSVAVIVQTSQESCDLETLNCVDAVVR